MYRAKQAIATVSFVAFILLFGSEVWRANSQINNPGITQNGSVTAAHCASWFADSVIQDAGTTCAGTAPVQSVFGRTGNVVSATNDYNFNQLAGSLGCTQMPAFTGDITNTNCAMTLASVIVAGGPTGSATVTPVLTYDAKGRLTVVSTATIAPPFSALTGSLACSQTPALTGDITSSAGSCATTLASIITAGGPTGSATVTPVLTYDAKGRLTVVSTATIAPPFSALTGSLACSQTPALTGDVTTSAGACATTLATVNANVGSFGSTTNCASFTVNGKGLITAASAAACAPPFTAVTGQATLAQLPSMVANTVLSNWTSGSATPLSNVWPACANDGGHALVYVNGTGLQCAVVGTTATAVDAGGATTTVSNGTSGYLLQITGTSPLYLNKVAIASALTAGAGIGITGTTNATIAASAAYFSAYLSSGQSVTSNTITKLQANTVVADNKTWYDNATNYRYTPLVAGKYRFHVQVFGDGTTASRLSTYLYKNGTSYANSDLFLTTDGSGGVDVIVSMNGSTDYVEAFGRVTCAASCAFDGGSGPILSWFEGQFISP